MSCSSTWHRTRKPARPNETSRCGESRFRRPETNLESLLGSRSERRRLGARVSRGRLRREISWPPIIPSQESDDDVLPLERTKETLSSLVCATTIAFCIGRANLPGGAQESQNVMEGDFTPTVSSAGCCGLTKRFPLAL